MRYPFSSLLSNCVRCLPPGPVPLVMGSVPWGSGRPRAAPRPRLNGPQASPPASFPTDLALGTLHNRIAYPTTTPPRTLMAAHCARDEGSPERIGMTAQRHESALLPGPSRASARGPPTRSHWPHARSCQTRTCGTGAVGNRDTVPGLVATVRTLVRRPQALIKRKVTRCHLCQ